MSIVRYQRASACDSELLTVPTSSTAMFGYVSTSPVFFFFFFFFDIKHLQTHSVNQSGNSASMCTTKDGWFLALRAKLSALRFAVRGT